MNIPTIIIICTLVIAAVLALRSIIKHKGGCSCSVCCGCSGTACVKCAKQGKVNKISQKY